MNNNNVDVNKKAIVGVTVASRSFLKFSDFIQVCCKIKDVSTKAKLQLKLQLHQDTYIQ